MRVLEVFGNAADIGRGHGSACSGMIRKYLDDRIGLASREDWSGSGVDREFIIQSAEDTLAHHERYSISLYAEMVAMAEAAGITPAEAVVVGGFTDLVDVVRGRVGTAPAEHNCTAVLNPELGIHAQTWDMHASAGEFVFMLKIDPIMGPDVFVQTTAGCLGQMGINEAGISVGINNLTSVGKPGVTWPFVVRKALEQTDLDDAVQAVLDADLAGGHNYTVMGATGEGANIEAMPRNKKVTRTNGSPLVHTNHCLHKETASEEGQRPSEHVAGSNNRLDIGNRTASDPEAFFADPAISRRASEPHDSATCGAVIMEPGKRRMRAVWGVPGDHPWETFQL